jgi:hypothetical protein
MNLAIAIIGALAAAVAAFDSWTTARKANASAASIVAIERDRRHDEMAPKFDITCAVRETAPDRADLRVVLTGGRLERLRPRGDGHLPRRGRPVKLRVNAWTAVPYWFVAVSFTR